MKMASFKKVNIFLLEKFPSCFSFFEAKSENAEVGTILNGVFRLFFLWCNVFSNF